jgi:hypothetical protein
VVTLGPHLAPLVSKDKTMSEELTPEEIENDQPMAPVELLEQS